MGFKLCFGVLVKLKVNVKIKCTLEQAMMVQMGGYRISSTPLPLVLDGVGG
jgi:hypothetical protein